MPNALFLLVLSMSIAGSAAAAGILLIKTAWRSRVSTRVGRDIWIVAMGLFLLPVRQIIPIRGVSDSVTFPVFHADNIASADITAIVPSANAAQIAPLDTVSSLAVSIPWHLVWAAGMLGYFVVKTVCYLRFRRVALKGSYPCRLTGDALNRALTCTGWHGSTKILYRSGLKTPLTFGILSPIILLPEKDYTDEHLQMVLIHELLHIKSRDLLYKLFAVVVAGVHWFNPLAHCMVVDFDAACELYCDYNTVKILGDNKRKSYCELLIDTASKPFLSLGGRHFSGFGVHNKLIKRRVYSIMEKNTPRPLINAFAVAAVVAVCLLGAACAPMVLMQDAADVFSQPSAQNNLTIDNGASSIPDSEQDDNGVSAAGQETAGNSGEELPDSVSGTIQSVDASQQVSGLEQSTLLRSPLIAGVILNPFNGYPGHTGVDYSAEKGADILASASGVVVLAESSEQGYGQYIIIDHGAGVKTLYAHCEKLLVQVGQKVESGDVIAKVGNTGSVSGPHLHFELRINDEYMNPMVYMKE